MSIYVDLGRIYVNLCPETAKMKAQICEDRKKNKEVTVHNGGGLAGRLRRPAHLCGYHDGYYYFFIFLPAFAYLGYHCWPSLDINRHKWTFIDVNSLYKQLKEPNSGSNPS